MQKHVTTSRRAILAGIAAAPVVAVPAIASESDAELFDLRRQLKLSYRRYTDALEAFNEVEKIICEHRSSVPPWPKPPAEYAAMYKNITVGQMDVLRDVMSNHPLVVWERETTAQRASLIEASGAEYVALKEKCGYYEADDHKDACADEFYELGEKLFATRAHTLAGIVAKIDAAKLVYPDGEGDIADAWDSVAADIRALAVQS